MGKKALMKIEVITIAIDASAVANQNQRLWSTSHLHISL